MDSGERIASPFARTISAHPALWPRDAACPSAVTVRHLWFDGDRKPFDCQNRDVRQDDEIANDGDELEWVTHHDLQSVHKGQALGRRSGTIYRNKNEVNERTFF